MLSLSKNQIAKLVSAQTINNSRLNKDQKEAINYKNALDYIKREWIVNNRQVSVSAIENLHSILLGKSINVSRSAKNDLNTLFSYLQTGGDHPCVQAGIVFASFIEIAPFPTGNDLMARLIPYLYLYKNGYDFREMFVLDEYFKKDLSGLNVAVQSIDKNKNLTLWLEYFLDCCLTQLEKAYQLASEHRFSTDIANTFFKLNNRQKLIYEMFDEPEIKITNKMVQKRFKVSQITSSRDLAKLTSLNLIFSHGKGRSTFYTKV